MAHSFHSHVSPMTASPSHTVCKAEKEHPEAVVPTRATRAALQLPGFWMFAVSQCCLARALTRAVGATRTAAQLWQRAGRKGMGGGTGEKRTQGGWGRITGAGVTPHEMVSKHKPWYVGWKQFCAACLTPKVIYC